MSEIECVGRCASDGIWDGCDGLHRRLRPRRDFTDANYDPDFVAVADRRIVVADSSCDTIGDSGGNSATANCHRDTDINGDDGSVSDSGSRFNSISAHSDDDAERHPGADCYTGVHTDINETASVADSYRYPDLDFDAGNDCVSDIFRNAHFDADAISYRNANTNRYADPATDVEPIGSDPVCG